MDIRKIIRLFYILFTIYIIMVINSTSLTFYYIFPSILIMWLVYLFFSLGYTSTRAKSITLLGGSKSWLLNRSRTELMILSSLSIFFSIAAVNYYTGQTPLSVIQNLSNNTSLYYEYQEYFSKQQRNSFSIMKIPFIFMLFYVKLLLFYTYVSLLNLNEKTNRLQKSFIIFITISFLYIGLARGTSFEMFEFTILLTYLLLSKQSFHHKLGSILKKYIGLIAFILIAIFIYYNSVKLRGIEMGLYVTQDIFYDPNGILYQISPFFTFITINLFGYFGFGFFYFSTYIHEIWANSIQSFTVGLLPFGEYIKGQNIGHVMTYLIDMGARWHPDITRIIDKIGVIGLLTFSFLLGALIKYIRGRQLNKEVLNLTNLMVLIFMISLPIGNFITVSSSNRLITFLLIIYLINKLFFNYKITLKKY